MWNNLSVISYILFWGFVVCFSRIVCFGQLLFSFLLHAVVLCILLICILCCWNMKVDSSLTCNQSVEANGVLLILGHLGRLTLLYLFRFSHPLVAAPSVVIHHLIQEDLKLQFGSCLPTSDLS